MSVHVPSRALTDPQIVTALPSDLLSVTKVIDSNRRRVRRRKCLTLSLSNPPLMIVRSFASLPAPMLLQPQPHLVLSQRLHPRDSWTTNWSPTSSSRSLAPLAFLDKRVYEVCKEYLVPLFERHGRSWLNGIPAFEYAEKHKDDQDVGLDWRSSFLPTSYHSSSR